MEQNGKPATITITWDESAKRVVVAFDNDVFKDWLGVRGMLWMAEEWAKQMHEAGQVAAMQQMAKEAKGAERILRGGLR